MTRNAVHVAVVGALMLGAAGGAQANFKGIAISEISNFSFTGTNPITLLATPTITAVNTAIWGANTEVQFDSGPPAPVDADVADCGPLGCNFGAPNNAFTQLADVLTDNWSRGDSFIPNINILGGTGASSVLSEVVAAPGVVTPIPVLSTSDNGLDATFSFAVAQTTTVTFEFDADTFWEVLTPGGNDISAVSSGFDFSISIQNAQGVQVFNWVPDGVPNNIPFGSDPGDPFTLNDDFFSQNGTGNTPTGGGSNSSSLLGSFLASVTLAPGNYALAISHSATADGSQEESPLPATVLLLGAGLFGIGVVRRRFSAA